MVNQFTLNDSSFAMWRALIALAYTDHKLAPEEIEFLKKRLEQLVLSDEQKVILDKDLLGGTKLEDVYEQITETKHKTNLLNLAYALFNCDKDYSNIEKEAYAELYAKHLKSIGISEPIENAKMLAEKFIDLDKLEAKAAARDKRPSLEDALREYWGPR